MVGYSGAVRIDKTTNEVTLIRTGRIRSLNSLLGGGAQDISFGFAGFSVDGNLTSPTIDPSPTLDYKLGGISMIGRELKLSENAVEIDTILQMPFPDDYAN